MVYDTFFSTKHSALVMYHKIEIFQSGDVLQNSDYLLIELVIYNSFSSIMHSKLAIDEFWTKNENVRIMSL